jgi:hypothetical protein
VLEYKCVEGKLKGMTHRSQDDKNVMIDAEGISITVDLQ